MVRLRAFPVEIGIEIMRDLLKKTTGFRFISMGFPLEIGGFRFISGRFPLEIGGFRLVSRGFPLEIRGFQCISRGFPLEKGVFSGKSGGSGTKIEGSKNCAGVKPLREGRTLGSPLGAIFPPENPIQGPFSMGGVQIDPGRVVFIQNGTPIFNWEGSFLSRGGRFFNQKWAPIFNWKGSFFDPGESFFLIKNGPRF